MYAYLHTNGNIIEKNKIVVDSKPGGPIDYFDSDFVVKWWKIKPEESKEEFRIRIHKEAEQLKDRIK